MCLLCHFAIVQFNAAPQPSTAVAITAPSQEDVGQGEVAMAAPIERNNDSQ